MTQPSEKWKAISRQWCHHNIKLVFIPFFKSICIQSDDNTEKVNMCAISDVRRWRRIKFWQRNLHMCHPGSLCALRKVVRSSFEWLYVFVFWAYSFFFWVEVVASISKPEFELGVNGQYHSEICKQNWNWWNCYDWCQTLILNIVIALRHLWSFKYNA